jgi:recombination protein RecR
MKNNRELDVLIELMAKLPGLGPRSARRAVLHLIRKRNSLLLPLADMLSNLSELCEICTNQDRGNGELCIVEDVSDLWAMERANIFKGRYHVLGGTLSALDAVGPEELRIPKMVNRVLSENVTEVILALNATIEGQTTAHYISEQLEDSVKVTSLAQGVPIGGELDYLDEGTITAALKARRQI